MGLMLLIFAAVVVSMVLIGINDARYPIVLSVELGVFITLSIITGLNFLLRPI